eukprot:scaffold1441_cov120-Isochrysis_galbana.AAC.13
MLLAPLPVFDLLDRVGVIPVAPLIPVFDPPEKTAPLAPLLTSLPADRSFVRLPELLEEEEARLRADCAPVRAAPCRRRRRSGRIARTSRPHLP